MYQYEYPRPAMTVDVALLSPIRNQPGILLIQRKNDPYAGCWALPGGFLDMQEELPTAACRELREETGVTVSESQLIPLGIYGGIERDPRGRTIGAVFMATVSEHSAQPMAADDAAKASWFAIAELPNLAFDHGQIVSDLSNLLRLLVRSRGWARSILETRASGSLAESDWNQWQQFIELSVNPV